MRLLLHHYQFVSSVYSFKMNLNKSVFQIAATVVVACGLCLTQNAFGQTNIIQIVADDLGWVDLSTGATNFFRAP